MEPEVSMMIMPSHLYNDLVRVANDYAQELLTILIITGIGPLRLESALEFDAEVHVARQDEFPVWLRIPQLMLNPV